MRERPSNSEKSDWLMDAGPLAVEPDEDRPLPTSRGVLSAAEIEALLRPKNLPQTQPEPETIQPRASVQFDTYQVDPEDAARREQATILASRLSIALSKGAGLKTAISLQELAEVSRSDLTGLMQGKSCAIACIGPDETDIRVLICMPPQLVDAIIAHACGARGSTGRIGDGWTLSAIDCALLEQLLSAFGAAVSQNMHLQAIETDVPYVASLIPADAVNVIEYAIEAPGLRSELAVIQSPQTIETHSQKPADVLATSSPVQAIVTARVARLSVPLSHLSALKAGSTLLLGLPGDQPIEVLSGGRDGAVAFEGQMGRKGNKMAVKITSKKRGVFK